MASAASARRAELRQNPTAGPLAAAGVFFFLAAALTYRADVSLWLSHHHAHVIEKALLVLDRGRLELIGFFYPPLPFLLMLSWPIRDSSSSRPSRTRRTSDLAAFSS